MWCPANISRIEMTSARGKALPRPAIMLPEGDSVQHPSRKACAKGWRFIPTAVTSTVHTRLDAWHEQLRIATRVAGREVMTASEMKNTCNYFDCQEFLRLTDKEKKQYSGYMVLTYVLSSITPLTPGLWLEFGVFKGSSLNMTADARMKHDGGKVHGFDSFEGLPTDWHVDVDRNQGVYVSPKSKAKGAGTLNRGSIGAFPMANALHTKGKGKGKGKGSSKPPIDSSERRLNSDAPGKTERGTGKGNGGAGKILSTQRAAGTFSLGVSAVVNQ